MKKELANSKAECVASKDDVDTTLKQMKFIAVDATLHARTKLMEEYKPTNMLAGIQTKRSRSRRIGRLH